MLPSGLAIYKTKLAPHCSGQRYVLGGSHASFDAILSKVGDTNQMINHFIAGLASWKNLVPPSLTQFLMSEDEETLAMKKNLKDDSMNNFRNLLDIEQKEFFQEIDYLDEVNFGERVDDKLDDLVPCSSCGDCVQGVYSIKYQENERVSRLKNILNSQDKGVEISYRCIRCRNCSDCQHAEKIDRISLREETELYEIRNSYKLDWKNGIITCTLPLRGKERDFLSSNEDRALKVLDSQCKRYYQDKETRDAIVQSFQKLIQQGYIFFIEDLSEDLKQ